MSQIKKGLPANGRDYQPYWGGDFSNPHERDSTPMRASQVMNQLKSILGQLNLKRLVLMDLGCNNGYFALEFLKTFPEAEKVRGIDYHKPAIDIANKIADNFHMTKAIFIPADLNNEREIGSLFTAIRPTIVFAMSIFHHLDDPMKLVSLCDMSAVILAIEYQHMGQYGKIEEFLLGRFDRVHSFETRYNNQGPDLTGESREMVFYMDKDFLPCNEVIDGRTVVDKWLQYHESGQINYFLLKNKFGLLYVDKFERHTEYDNFKTHSFFIAGMPVLDLPKHQPPSFRQLLFSVIFNLALSQKIHGDLLTNLIYENKNGSLTVIDYDTVYSIKTTLWADFYRARGRFMKHFNKNNPIQQTLPTTEKEYLQLDIKVFKYLCNYFHLTPLSREEQWDYFSVLLYSKNKEIEEYFI